MYDYLMGLSGPYYVSFVHLEPSGPSGRSGSLWTLWSLWTSRLGMYSPLFYVSMGAQDVPSHLLLTVALFGVIWAVKPHHHPMGQVHRMF